MNVVQVGNYCPGMASTAGRRLSQLPIEVAPMPQLPFIEVPAFPPLPGSAFAPGPAADLPPLGDILAPFATFIEKVSPGKGLSVYSLYVLHSWIAGFEVIQVEF
jgi:hypothetical protein